ncbi:MAG: phage major capsid protein [Sulfolobaceae archaeon]
MAQTGYSPTNTAYVNAIFGTLHRNIQPRVTVQNLRKSKPLLKWLLSNCAKPESDSPIIKNVQFNRFASANQFTDYSGTFVTGVNDVPLMTAQWYIAAHVNPITSNIFELSKFLGAGKVNQIIDVVSERLTDNYETFLEVMNNAILGTSNNVPALLYQQPANNAILPDGLQDAIDNGTLKPTYGGITRSTYPAWNAFVYTNSQSSVPAWQQLYFYLMSFINDQNGTLPDIMVCGPDVYYAVATSMTSIERVIIQTGNTVASDRSWEVQTIDIAGVPLVVDKNMPAATVYFLKAKNLELAYNPDFFMELIPAESLISTGQLGYVQVMIATYELLTTLPSGLAMLKSAPAVTLA